MGDGALGRWGAVAQVWPTRAEQRCGNHTRRHVVDAVPLKQQPSVLADVQTIAAAESRAEAETARRAFHHTYRLRFPNASERIDRDWARMLTYCDFPNDHWRHLRTTNVVESPFDAVRLRTSAAKRFKKVEHATAILWRLLRVAEQRVRKLDAPNRCRDVFHGAQYQPALPLPHHP